MLQAQSGLWVLLYVCVHKAGNHKLLLCVCVCACVSHSRRSEIFTTCEGDKPLLVQFCANDPNYLVRAANIAAPHADAIDINFGCPQRIAK